MAFQVPKSKRHEAASRFEFELDEQTHSIPLLKFMPVESAEAFEAGQNVQAILLACETDAARRAVRSMDGEQFEAFMDAWQEASGVTVGESAASSES